ncbi:Hemerythrin HHE cation binding domain-containing protein [Noviherbaspirillum humi]|uniref:Hemerythrin HHE cation binding domain-containing protein n=1 Tax=Noviherbaspirillum humi TaxID=1688639 RepID=A0A239KMB5_9BURK|nr:hemerythrin domain-containing protein [Noviherbaspirillum humi]SNT18304.1 Hemerythrin HHE cation binding domain-containing protein [Noviherbaspirillum humi]
MEMDVNMNEHRGSGGFPVDSPLEALKKDHHFVKMLFERYLGSQDMKVKQEAGPRILQLLEMHDMLEERVFYPRVHECDPSLVDHCEEEHAQARQMMDQLKGMTPGDAQFDQLLAQLQKAILHHVQQEEQQLFPKVEQSKMDMTKLGLEMQAFESNMVSTQARMSGQQPGMRK